LTDLVVAGAGMGGLAAAARARELGATVALLEKGDRPGGSMLLSSGYAWRYRDLATFREQCPTGDPELQRLVQGGVDDALAWLESLGAPVLERETGNPLTVGWRFDVRRLTDALALDVRLGEPLEELPEGVPVVLATGGFQGNRELVRRHITPHADRLVLRAGRWSTGDGLLLGLGAGGSESAGMGEFYGRNMPAPPARAAEADFVRLGQLYARHAAVEDLDGARYEPRTWSEIDVVQWTAGRPGARARYVVPDAALLERVRGRTVADMVEAARAAGAPVERREGATAVEVSAGITTTLGGLRVDTRLRVAEGVHAYGADVGGISTGGWMSGLATALVTGRLAAEAALGRA